MKKHILSRFLSVLPVLCAAVVCLTVPALLPASAAEAEPAAPVVFGDANGDCRVSAADLMMIRRYLAEYDAAQGTSPVTLGPDGKYFFVVFTPGPGCRVGVPFGDANGDGIINLLDLALVRGYLANLNYATGLSSITLGGNCPHHYAVTETVAATCCDAGHVVTTCSLCGNSVYEILPASGHDFSDGWCHSCGLTGGEFSDSLAFSSNGDGTCTVTGIGSCTDTVLHIPERNFCDEKVIAIADGAFRGCDFITGVTFPGTLETIGEGAFLECTSLRAVRLTSGITQVGAAAFAGCTSLTDLSVSGESRTFRAEGNCLIRVSDHCLIAGCGASVLPDDGSVVSVGEYAFALCGEAFSPAALPACVRTVGAYAFTGCAGLTDFTLPATVEAVGTHAFRACPALRSVTVASAETSLGVGAFADCPALERVTTPSAAGFSAVFGSDVKEIVLTGGISLPERAFSGFASLVSVTLPDSMRGIGDLAFYGCSRLENVTFGASVDSIGKNAFYNCVSLRDLTLPARLASIGDFAFGWCTGLTSLTLPDRLISVGTRAFENCLSLAEIYNFSRLTVTAGSTSNGEVAFHALAVHTSADEASILVKVNGVVFAVADGQAICLGGPGAAASALPASFAAADGTEYTAYSIGSCAFDEAGKIASIVLPAGVICVEDDAFIAGEGIGSISVDPANPVYECLGGCLVERATGILILGADNGTVSSGVTEIAPYAFYGCTGLTAVTVPDGVSIGHDAFGWCPSLTSVTIGRGVTAIGASAFDGCGRLETVVFAGTADEWAQITLGANCLGTAKLVFAGE